jgi:hypothetical protein
VISEESKSISEDLIENVQDIFQEISSRDIISKKGAVIASTIDIEPILVADNSKTLLPHEDENQNEDLSVGPVLDPVLGYVAYSICCCNYRKYFHLYFQ